MMLLLLLDVYGVLWLWLLHLMLQRRHDLASACSIGLKLLQILHRQSFPIAFMPERFLSLSGRGGLLGSERVLQCDRRCLIGILIESGILVWQRRHGGVEVIHRLVQLVR